MVIQASGSTGRRVLYFDLLNIAACICVVYLHSNVMVHSFVPGGNWMLSLAIECFFYWAVPVFFMLTGATLMRYRDKYDTKTFFRKRVMRTVVPFVAWNLIWYLKDVVQGYAALSPSAFLSMMMSNQIVVIYWFFFPLFSVYLSMPALSLLADHVSVLRYLVIAAFALQSLAPQLCTLLGLSWNPSFIVSAASGYIIFVLLGYLLSTQEINKETRFAIYTLGVFGLLFRFVYTLMSSEASGGLDRTFFDYLGFPAILYGVAIFTWFKYHDWAWLEKYSKRVASISACSFGVYLVHYPMLQSIVFGYLGVPVTSIPFRLIGAFLFYLAVLFLVYAMRKIPGLRSLIP